ncbi:MAG: hypothetical protein KatS3mg105_0205 [Gemmatales bacterium]|nr:MAG: hypothetical protein KatS3mg105_0205 [Gemmatales bacterium]
MAALLPTGFRGIFLAAFVAALMSSMDSYLNSAATVFSNDFYKRFFSPTIDERELLLVGRSTTIVLVIWAILFAFLLTYLKEGVYAIFQTMMAFFQGPALAILMTGLLWRRATATAAFVGFLAGVTIAIVLFVFSQSTVCELLGIAPLFQISEPFLYFSVWAFLVALVSIVVVSWCTPKEPEEKTALVVSLLKKERVD